MKNKIKNSVKLLIAIFTITTIFSSCTKEETKPAEVKKGTVTFWNNQTNVGNITVNMSGSSSVITYNVYPTGCDISGCANFSNISYGVHSYSASSTTGQTWSGTVDVQGSCIRFNLYVQ